MMMMMMINETFTNMHLFTCVTMKHLSSNTTDPYNLRPSNTTESYNLRSRSNSNATDSSSIYMSMSKS